MLCLVWSTGCPKADFQTAIGGKDFNVEKISSAANLEGDFLVGGLVTMLNEYGESYLTSFLYLLKTSDCTVPWSHEFPNMNYDH